MSLGSRESSGLRESSGEHNWHGVRYVQIDALFLARHWSKRRGTELLRSKYDMIYKLGVFRFYTIKCTDSIAPRCPWRIQRDMKKKKKKKTLMM